MSFFFIPLRFLQIIPRGIEDILISKVGFIHDPVEIVARHHTPECSFMFAKFAHIEN